MPRVRTAALGLGAALALGVSAGSASGQGSAVNNCTLLTDPTLMRQCVERARQGGNAGASPSSSQDAYSPQRTGARETSPGLTTAAPLKAEAPGGKRGKRGKAPAETGPDEPRPGKIP